MLDDKLFLRVQNFSFALVGIDINASTNVGDRKLLSYAHALSVLLFVVPLVCGMNASRDDLDLVTEGRSSLTACLLTIFKFCYFLKNREHLVDLTQAIRTIMVQESRTHAKHAEIVQQAIAREQMLSKAYTISYWLLLMLAAIKPITLMVLNYLSTGHVEYVLPYVTIFPFSTEHFLTFMPTFMWSWSVGFSVIVMATCTDTLLFAFIYNIGAIFQIGQHKIRSFQPTGGSNELRDLNEFFKFHQNCLAIASQMRSLYKPIIFVQFLVISIQLCVTGFQVADKIGQPECIYFMSFGLTLLMNVYIYSHCGEILKTESLGLALAIYECPWYELRPECKRSLIVAAMRASYPCLLSGFVVEANMETYAVILKSSVSYITMLRSFT